MKLIKLPILMAAITMLMLGMTACSGDDSSISVYFTLQDESGVEKSSFKEGENIIFRLDITNHSEEEALLSNLIDMFFNDDIFHVYSSKGEDYGNPYDVLFLPEIGHLVLDSQSRNTYLCPWVNNPDSELSWNPLYLSYEIEKLRPLPQGDYYSVFAIKLDNNRVVTCRKTFKIE